MTFLLLALLLQDHVDYLVITTETYADQCEELLAHRKKQGLSVGIALVSKIGDIRAHVAKVKPTYVLLVGDVDTVPAVVRDADFYQFGTDKDLATDFEYACPDKELEPTVHVGRFPCDTREELAVMIRKTLDYETKLEAGTWQKKISFIAGEAGFSPEADQAIEKLFIQIVSTTVPAFYDVEVAYANARSIFCPYPPSFNDNALRLLNEGSLLYVFVGHGSNDHVARFTWENNSYNVLSDKDAPKIDVQKGSPLMVVIACSTGEYDHKKDCLGEVWFKSAKGPVAFVGGSRITHPYGNALLGREMALHVLGEAKTVGEGITRVKRALLTHEMDKFNKQVDAMTAFMGIKKETLEPVRKDTVRHYNLLGDPALVLRRPAPIQLARDGKIVTIECAASEVTLTLEDPREKIPKLEKIDRKDPDYQKKIDERYRLANARVLKTWTVKLENGKGTVEVEGEGILKAFAPGFAGSLP